MGFLKTFHWHEFQFSFAPKISISSKLRDNEGCQPHPTLQCLILSSGASFLLMSTLGGSRWWLKFLHPSQPSGRSGLSFCLPTAVWLNYPNSCRHLRNEYVDAFLSPNLSHLFLLTTLKKLSFSPFSMNFLNYSHDFFFLCFHERAVPRANC